MPELRRSAMACRRARWWGRRSRPRWRPPTPPRCAASTRSGSPTALPSPGFSLGGLVDGVVLPERLARRQAERGQASFLYLFDHDYPAMDEADLHAFHASELPYMFGTLDRTGPYWPRIPDTSRETALSDTMIDYWTSFVAMGVPRAAGAPAWPTFRENRTAMHFAAGPRPVPKLLGTMFDLNQDVILRRRAANTACDWNVGLTAPPSRLAAA